MKKYGVLGLGKSGLAAAEFLLNQGNEVWGIDHNMKSNPLAEKGLVFRSEEKNIPHFDQLIISPGIPKTKEVCRLATEVIGEIELACRYLKTPVIAVTGTNGKTTVTSLITHILKESGINAKSVGNIGEPLISQVNSNKHLVLVVELSSYQIETLSSPCFDAGIILNVTPDHLERYGSMHAYCKVKFKLQKSLKKDAPFFVNERILEEYLEEFDQKTIVSFGFLTTSDVRFSSGKIFLKETVEYNLPLRYKYSKSYEMENIIAAAAIAEFCDVLPQHFFQAIESFVKPPHRLEFVGNVEGVDYYNDSKGTNVDAVLKAVEALNQPILLIAGGVDKGISYSTWLEVFKTKVRQLFVFGQAAERMKIELKEVVEVTLVTTMKEAFVLAGKVAKKGDLILLSPGCSSFDMFKNYEERGQLFKELVEELRSVK